MRETAAPPLGSGHHKLRPSCDRTPVFRDIATITSGFGAVTIIPEHHSLIADEPIMTTTAFPTGRPNYRYKKASKEGRTPGLSRPRRPEVTSGRSSSCPTPCRPLPHLLHCPLCGPFSALFLATLIRALLSTHRILYPRLLLIGVAAAVLIQVTAWCVTWHYWPWASTRVMPFIIVAGAGFAVGSCFLDLATQVHLLPWTAGLAGSAIAVADQWRRRLRWRAHARRALETAS